MEPLFFDSYLVDKPWGGEQLTKAYNKRRQCDKGVEKIGESWELSAESDGVSVVRNGEHAGKSLAYVYRNQPQLFGDGFSQFPFTVKLIDAEDTLSVQLHGNTAAAANSEQCEAWYIIKAEPGASIVLGANIETPEELRHAIATGTIERYLRRIEVREGDVIYVPTGMLHSIGAGILLYEIRHPGMITYRAYDWGRGRELHIDECCNFYRSSLPLEKIKPSTEQDGTQTLIDCEHFSLELIHAGHGKEQITDKSFIAYTALGAGQIEMAKVYPYRAGDTFIVPAGIGRFLLRGGTIIRAEHPKYQQDKKARI